MIQEPKKKEKKKDFYKKSQESEDHLNAYNRTHWTTGEHNRKEYTLKRC